jgi:hypothetical protein
MKGIIRRLRPSPAMVVACIALLFAMTGAGYAAGMLGPNTVGTKQLKKNAVISSKVKNRSLLAVDFKAGQIPAGPQGPAGPAGPAGPQGPGARWAAVNPDGSIALQSGGITVSHATTGVYIVNFGENVSRRMISVTPATVNDPNFRGTAVGSPCAPPGAPNLIDCPATNPQNYVFVGELASGDASTEDHGFYVAAIGPDAPATGSPMKPSHVVPGPFSAK